MIRIYFVIIEHLKYFSIKCSVQKDDDVLITFSQVIDYHHPWARSNKKNINHLIDKLLALKDLQGKIFIYNLGILNQQQNGFILPKRIWKLLKARLKKKKVFFTSLP